MKNDKEPSGRKPGMDRDAVGPVHSRERPGLDSEEVMTANTQKDGHFLLSQSDDQRREENGLNDDLTPDQSKDVPDWDSVEENQGRLAAARNSKGTDYDGTVRAHFNCVVLLRTIKN